MIGGFAVQAENWRWSFWELLWFCGPVLVVLLLAFPETSSDAILHRRAARLRRLTGRTDLCTAAEIERSKMSRNEILFDALIKPWEINVLDPAVLFTTFYLGVVYVSLPRSFSSWESMLTVSPVHLLLILRIVPLRLPGRLQLQPRPAGPGIPLRPDRHSHCLRVVCGVFVLLGRATVFQNGAHPA